MLQMMFRKVSVELDERHAPPEPPNPFTSIFVFDGVEINTECGIGELDPAHERGRLYMVTLRVLIDNQPKEEAQQGKYSPYLIDVDARGVVIVPKAAEQLAPPEDLAMVNGASLLWSAVREQVLSLTSRMLAGPVMLPTMNFHDLRKGPESSEAAEPVAKPLKGRKAKISAAKE
ncbi:hypothetical protein [Candidatus Accumulibacter phosphatis]|uniref:hypothetical protein n=1 Tax=Candidatus Accumulibacter phosphatis TaxID=327160 RepID=UPI00110A2418|nr:hypothetical protein [Candidatus Accumulibacter phosphatis]